MLSNTLEQLQAEQNDLASYNSYLISLQTQPERAQTIMLENARRLQEIRNELNNVFNDSAKLRDTQIELLQIEQNYLQQQNEYQKRVLQGNTQLQEVLQKQRDYTIFISNNLKNGLNCFNPISVINGLMTLKQRQEKHKPPLKAIYN